MASSTAHVRAVAGPAGGAPRVRPSRASAFAGRIADVRERILYSRGALRLAQQELAKSKYVPNARSLCSLKGEGGAGKPRHAPADGRARQRAGMSLGAPPKGPCHDEASPELLGPFIPLDEPRYFQ